MSVSHEIFILHGLKLGERWERIFEKMNFFEQFLSLHNNNSTIHRKVKYRCIRKRRPRSERALNGEFEFPFPKITPRAGAGETCRSEILFIKGVAAATEEDRAFNESLRDAELLILFITTRKQASATFFFGIFWCYPSPPVFVIYAGF